MLLLLKGTYATDSPIAFADYNNGTGLLYQDTQDAGAGGDPAFDLFALPTATSLNFLWILEKFEFHLNTSRALLDWIMA